MPTQFAFNWGRPGALEWLLVSELILLAVMWLYLLVANLLGRSSPTDPLVIFYRVFWRAFRYPRRYPVPVDYQPVPPRKRQGVGPESCDDLSGLTEEELASLMAREEGEGDASASESRDPLGATRQAQLDVVVQGNAPTEGPCRFDGDRLVVNVTCGADDGRANAAVSRAVCRVFNLQLHQIALLHGHTKARKALRLTGLAQSELSAHILRLGGGGTSAATPAGAAVNEADVGLVFRDD